MAIVETEVGIEPAAQRALRRAWQGALVCFVLAGLTGAFFRFGIAYGWTAGLGLVNIRHAHSHLMYFGWVTPALMALLSLHLPALTGRPLSAGLRRIGGVIFFAALLTYPFFLALGYTPVEIGTARLPLAVISSTANVFCWYVFVWCYWREMRGVERTRALLLWDLAATFLVLASLGAWGLALLKPLGIEDPAWVVGLTHVFLDLFSEGWFVLGVLGLLHARAQTPGRAAHWSIVLVVLGLPVTFALGMPDALVPPGLHLLARVGGTLVAVGLLANVAILWRAGPGGEGWFWKLPLLMLALKALAELSVGVLPDVRWAGAPAMRVLYLHVMLLGFVSLGLVGVAAQVFERVAAARWFYAAVALLLVSLLPLTPLWPGGWQGRWTFVAAAWIALGPVVAAAGLLASSRRSSARA